MSQDRESYVIHTGANLDEQIYVEVDPQQSKLVLLGDTYRHKDRIRLAGGLWNASDKHWYMWEGNVPDVLKKLGEVRRVDQAHIETLIQNNTPKHDAPPPPSSSPFSSRFSNRFGSSTPPKADNTEDKPQSKPDDPPVQTVVVEKIVEVEKTVEVEKIVHSPAWRKKKRGKKAPMAKQRVWRNPALNTQSPDYIKPSWWQQVCFYLRPGKCRPAIALVGPAGNGKTTAARQALDALGMGYVEIDCNESMMPDALLGRMELTTQDGATVTTWADGLVTRAFREGKAIILNEFDALDPRTALCLQSACQHPGKDGTDRFITLPEHPTIDKVYPVGDCPIIVTMNTYGNGSREYVGRNVLDAATADRFSMITTDYENEAAIIESKGYTKKIANAILSWAEHVRQVLKNDTALNRIVLGNRIFINIADCMAAGMKLENAVEWEFFGRLDAQDRELLEAQLSRKYRGAKVS